MSEELVKAPPSLSLRRLHELLNLRGVEVSYSTLSEFVGYGDIAEQLHVGGGANRREFPADTVDVLVNFWPLFRESGGRKPNAPALLRRFLDSGSDVSRTGELARLIGSLEVSGTSKLPDVVITREELLEAISEGVRRSFPAPVPVLPDDILLTIAEARERYGLALSTLRAISFVEGRRRKVRRSDVLGLIQGMGKRGIE